MSFASSTRRFATRGDNRNNTAVDETPCLPANPRESTSLVIANVTAYNCRDHASTTPYRLEQLVVGQPIPVPAQQLSDDLVHNRTLSNRRAKAQ